MHSIDSVKYSMYRDFRELLTETERVFNIQIPQTENSNIFSGMAELYNSIQHCRKCRLANFRRNVVFGEGKPDAEILIIGGYPETIDADTAFIGETRELLSKMLAAISLNMNDIFFTDAVKCCPPKGRVPEIDEYEACSDNLFSQINMIKPKYCLIFGEMAAQIVLKNNLSLSSMQQKVYKIGSIYTMATYSPAEIIQDPKLKRFTWETLKKFRNLIDSLKK